MTPKKLPIVLERGEIEKLLGAPNTGCPTGLRNRAVLEVMYRAGLRVSEVVGLRTADIRWESATLEVHNGKGGRDRNVPVDQETIGWFRAWEAKRPKGRYFFCTLKGGKLLVRYIQAMVKRLAYRANLERADAVTPHTLRHTYATELLDEGFTIREVQVLLGHANIQTTQIYTHVRPNGVAAKIRERGMTREARQQAEALAAKIAALPEEARKVLVEVLKIQE